MRQSKPILFLHIPKSAGTSVTEVLVRNFNTAESIRLSQRNNFESDLASAVRKYKFVSGHIPFSVVQRHLDETYCFTILRNPISRVISLYEFWRSFDPADFEGLEESASVMHAKKLSLEEFVACRHPLVREEASNGMCKMLSSSGDIYGRSADETALFEDARKNLDALHFGVTEDMEKTYQLLGIETGLNLQNDVHLNVFRNEKYDAISAREVQAILEQNRADSRLFAYAVDSLRRRHQDQQVEIQIALHGRSVLSPLRKLDGGRFSWDATQRLCGANWHEHEMWNAEVPYRFTSGSSESSIYFDNPFDGDFVVRVFVLFFAQDQFCEPLQSVQLKINNLTVPVEATLSDEGGAILQAKLSQKLGQNTRTLKLSLVSTYGFVPQLALTDSVDRRCLFAAVTGIDLYPG